MKHQIVAKMSHRPSSRLEVPTFDNTIEGYKEFRKRCLLYQARMKLEGNEKVVALSILGQLNGIAWDCCESLADKPDAMDQPDSLARILEILDARFKVHKATELPEVFEEYFYKGNRRAKETLFEYIQRIRLSTRKVKEFDIELPDPVQGWFLLRRAGLTEEQKTLIMSQVGKDLSFEKVSQALQTTLGQQQTKTTGRDAYFQHDDYVEHDAYQPYTTSEWYGDDGWEEHDDVYYQDYDDEQEPEYEDEEWYEEGDPDDGASYYYHPPSTEDVLDVDEYDDVYTNYVEARKRLNDLKLARGFYPIVALGPEFGSRSVSSTGKGTKSRRGKGKGKTRPTKGKGKTKSTTRSAPSSRMGL